MEYFKLIVWKCAAQCHARIITLVSKRSSSIKQETLLPQQIAQAFFRTRFLQIMRDTVMTAVS